MIDEKHELIFGWYLVAFLDVLGQREKLRQLRGLPQSEQERLETYGLLTETVGSVLQLRRLFQKYFENFVQPTGLLDHLSAGQQEKIERIKQTAEYRGFSDSFVVSVALRNDDEHLTPAVGLYSSLIAACIAMNVSLARQRPLRGGIDVGLGVNIAPGEVYGPALERAYLLEGCVAEHPRILVGDELWHYISEVETENATGPYGRVAHQLLREVKELIVIDADGRRILDYLGPGVLALGVAGFASELVKPAYDFVVQQHEYWTVNSNSKLCGRYAKVRQYIEERLSLWGLGIA